MYWVGSGWVNQPMGWVGSGHTKWTHGPLWVTCQAVGRNVGSLHRQRDAVESDEEQDRQVELFGTGDVLTNVA